jgi:hypothetical protein
MNDYELGNLMKAIELCFKENYYAMTFRDLYDKFYPVDYDTLLYTARVLEDNGRLIADGDIIRLVVR